VKTPPPAKKLGVWLFGALGGLATTMVVGARAIAKGKAAPLGMLTATPAFARVPLAPIQSLLFGGHELRPGDWNSAAAEMQQLNGTLPWPLLQSLRADLKQLSRNLRRGCLPNAGRTITRLVGGAREQRPLRQQLEQVQADLRAFVQRHRLDSCVCVNLASTEPPLRSSPAHRSIAAFERAIDRNQQSAVRPSSIYAYAAASLSLPFLNFTPSNGAVLLPIRQRFEQDGTPYMGNDGKTGETLVKSALAPMFKYRNLRVLTWQGYNILGDRDGAVLSDEQNKRAKVQSKDALLPRILGYPLHTHVGIDYVPSLQDHKTAWDFIHFEGFLGHKMAMQFQWQGCDSILAAPLVLDMVRLLDLSRRRGEGGLQPHLACFFKQPLGVDEHDLHEQWHLLTDYLARVQ
jgi:myo-inositol-1-phosphate synthase